MIMCDCRLLNVQIHMVLLYRTVSFCLAAVVVVSILAVAVVIRDNSVASPRFSIGLCCVFPSANRKQFG